VTTTLTRRAIAALFLERQHLRRPRGTRFTQKKMLAFIEDAGGLQIDSINVIDRAHYLTTWSRFDLYNRAALDRMAYRRRDLFEYWAHAACLVPTSHFPAWRRAMLERQKVPSWARWVRKNHKVVDAVESAVRERGPLGTADFEHTPGTTGGWWNWKPASYALDYLWRSGRFIVHSRMNFQKRYDLAERLMPAALEAEPLSEDEFVRWHVSRSLHAMGAALESELRLYLSYPGIPRPRRQRALKQLLSSGEVVETKVKDAPGRWLCLARDLDALAAAGRRRQPSTGVTLLAPFDSFMWHRDRITKLFGFDYRIEVYVPEPKRVYGYYVLPILADGHFIGRADVKANRQKARLEVKALHFEQWFAKGEAPPVSGWRAPDRAQTLERLGEAFRSLGMFTGAPEVHLKRVTPSSLARETRRAILGA
jgi:uncharacterized protein YcaQ